MAFDRVPRIFRPRHEPHRPAILQSISIPEQLAAILERAATEQQRLTWEALRQYARHADLPLEVVVVRAWGRRFPFVELCAAGVPQHVLRCYEQGWLAASPGEQTRRLAAAFAYAATVRQ